MSFIKDALTTAVGVGANIVLPGTGGAASGLISSLLGGGKSSTSTTVSSTSAPAQPALIDNPAWLEWNAKYGLQNKASRFGGEAPPPAPPRYINDPNQAAINSFNASVSVGAATKSQAFAETSVANTIHDLTGVSVPVTTSGFFKYIGLGVGSFFLYKLAKAKKWL